MPAPKANPTSLQFASASSQYVTVPSNVGLNITGDLTVEFFLKPTTNPASNNLMAYVGRYDGGAGQTAWMAYQYNNAGTPQMRLLVSNNGTALDVHSFNYTPAIGSWHHYAFVFTSSTHTVQFYVDGVLVGTDSTGTITSISTSTLALRIGVTTEASPSGYYNGNINNIRVWSVARTAGQIADRVADVTSATGLVAWWRCKDTAGTTLTDVAGGFNGTLTNSPTWSTDVPFTVHESTANSNEAASGRFFTHPNLVSLYKLEDTSDSKGTNTLTNNGSVVFDTGKYNNAADFGTNNTSKYLSAGNNLGISGTTAMSWGFWVYLPNQITSGLWVLASMGAGNGASYFQVYYNYNAGTPQLTLDAAGSATTYTVTLSTGTWHHIGCVRDVTNSKAILYLDGAEVAATALGSGTTTSSYFNIGVDTAASAHYASVKIDDFAVFNAALSDADVMDLYIGKKVASTEFSTLSLASDANLVSYYKAENTSDSKGTNTLTNNNTVAFNPGKFNNGFDLGSGNTNKYMSVSNDLGIAGNAALTFSIWFKMYSVGTTQVLIQHSSTTGASKYFQIYATSSNTVQFDFAGSGINSGVITSGVWHNAIFTRDASGNGYAFLDGVYIGSVVASTGVNGSHFNIGVDTSNYSSAIIDDIPVFNRKLTPDEVALIFYGAGSSTTTFPSLMLIGVGC